MSASLKRLPLDTTGVAPDNFIEGEVHTLVTVTNRDARVTVLHHGRFFTNGLVVRDNNGVKLTPHIDYQATYLYRKLSMAYAQEICGVIVVTNPNVTARIHVDYHALGGQYEFVTPALRDTLDALTYTEQSLSWGSVIGKPKEYPVAEHTHKFWQLYGLESTNHAIDDLADARLVGRVPVNNELQRYIDYLLDLTKQELDANRNALTAHIEDLTDPHLITKTQVGLPRVANYPVATQQQANDRVADDVYLTPALGKGTIDAVVKPALDEHLATFTNVHNVTPAQADAYSTDEANDLLAQRLPIQGKAYDANKLGGKTYAELYSDARTDIPGGNITSGVLDPARLGVGTLDRDHVLMGNSQWRDLDGLFAEYEEPSTGVYYAGDLGSRSNALNSIQNTYSNATAYPPGTVVLFRSRFEHNTYYGNGTRYNTYSPLDAAIRTGSGWTLK